MAMAKGEITDVLRDFGVSKLSRTMCSHYIRAFNEVVEQGVSIKGSNGKAYPGWSWPILPARNAKLRQAFLEGITMQKLIGDAKITAWRHSAPLFTCSG